MGPQDAENTDVSSIKPVSSLRSKFENLTTPAVPRSLTPTPNTIKPSTLQTHLDADRPRTSLDLPRRSPWSLPGESTGKSDGTKGAGSMTAENVQKRILEPGKASSPRPVSMGTWSRPSSPPAVTLQSPVSPPKPILGDAAKFSMFQSPVRMSLDFPIRSPAASSSPPTLPLSVTPPRSKTTQDVDFRKPAAPSPLANVKIPPPVNRARKPATPTLGAFTPSALDPRVEQKLDNVSPFSTPPDSPTKRENDAAPHIPTSTKPIHANSLSKATSYFPPPPTHHAVDAQRRESESAASGNNRQHQGLRNGSVGAMRPPDRSDRPELRPELPTRRNESPAKAEDRLAPESSRASLDIQRRRPPSPAPPRPSEASKGGLRTSMDQRRPTAAEMLPPPPKRNVLPNGQEMASSPPRAVSVTRAPERRVISSNVSVPPVRAEAPLPHAHESQYDESGASANSDYPDASQTNRRPPRSKYGVAQVYPDYDTRSLDICGDYVCTIGHYTKAWDLKTGRMVLDTGYGERETKVTAMAFKPGATTEQEGQFIWLGNNYGEIQEMDIRSKQITQTKSGAHNHRGIIQMHRYQNSILSIDEDGKLHLWPAGTNGVPSLSIAPLSFRVSRGHTFSLIVQHQLWLAAGKEIRVYNPMSQENFHVTMQALVQPGVGEITTGAIISNQLDRVYFGHSDGKVSIWSASRLCCIGVVNVSSYKINTLSGAGHYLWAGFNTGMIYVYDTRTSPWMVRKDWLAHQHPVAKIVTDRSSVWKVGHLQVASIGLDNTIRLWDGFLEDDWIESDMQERDVEFCDFREIKTVIVTWNAGATTPQSLRFDEKDTNFFRKVIHPEDPPDILVFGFQELVDLEDKKLTAKSIFKGSKKKETGSDHDHMSRQYRAWRDYLVQLLEEEMPQTQSYQLLHTANMVGLFSCVFIKSSQHNRVRGLTCGEVKRGLGGLHGNKGALIMRFILDDSSLCFTNCHLAAGQTQTLNRNNDATAILESAVLPREPDLDTRTDLFIGGGDGSMIMDHEICILNGDLNYRIDTMGRDTVVKAIKANNLAKLLERDQLLVSRRRNPGFRLRSFNEQPIGFAPTYKYDVGTDRYDTSEKSRSPAWCDRVLYRGVGRVKPLEYRRHELRVSDHRPVSATFKMRIKSIVPERRKVVWEECEKRLGEMRLRLARDAKLDYLVSVLGVEQKEASRLIAQ